MPPDYLLVGHLTRDLLPTGGSTPGGTALHAALTAYRLGRRVAVVTAPTQLPADWPTVIALAFTASEPPTFENRYQSGQRTQLLHTSASPMTLNDIPVAWRNAPIIHLGPVAQEVPESLVYAFPGALIGVTPQGWMRHWERPLPAPVTYTAWQPPTALLERVDALVLSIEDVQGDLAQVQAYAKACRLVALTHGVAGATLFIDGIACEIAAQPAIERDPTGAGDVFAATLFCALHAGKPARLAAEAAAQVAAASVEVIGAGGLLRMDM